MKLFILSIVTLIILATIACIFIGTIIHFRSNDTIGKIKWSDAVLLVFEEVCEIFCIQYFFVIILLGVGYVSLITNLKAYDGNGQVVEKKMMLEKMAIHNNLYVYKDKDEAYYEYLPRGQGEIKQAYQNVSFYGDSSDNYLVIKYDNYTNTSGLPEWIIDGWANKKGKKHVISYDFYTK
jgi:hypothetical protein